VKDEVLRPTRGMIRGMRGRRCGRIQPTADSGAFECNCHNKIGLPPPGKVCLGELSHWRPRRQHAPDQMARQSNRDPGCRHTFSGQDFLPNATKGVLIFPPKPPHPAINLPPHTLGLNNLFFPEHVYMFPPFWSQSANNGKILSVLK
jgi:hypothetical protein